MTTAIAETTEWSVETLYDRLDNDSELFVLDVRAEDEFEIWRLEGRDPLPTLNIPYYEMLEVDEHDDVVDTFRDFLSQGTTDKLPKDRPILTVCAKGDTSEYVAEALRRLDFDAVNLTGGTAAWGDHYHSVPLVESDELTVLQFNRPARGCLSYIVASKGQAAVIDPGRHIDQYLAVLDDRGWKLDLVLDTHGHADHISGGPELAEKTGAPYFLHPYDGIHPIDVLPATIPYNYLEDKQELSLGASRFEILHIPGHTLGNVAYLLDGKFLFTGDSIFIESIARPDLGGHGDTWAPLHYHSLRRLLELPGKTMVLPAHFSRTSEADKKGLFGAQLGDLAGNNEGLQMASGSEEDFVKYILESLPEFPDEYVEIKRVNAGLKEVCEDAASELELGKNICALSQAYAEAS